MQMPPGQRHSALVQPNSQQNQLSNSLDVHHSSKNNSYTPKSQSFLNDPECIALRERLLNGDDPNCLSQKDESENPSFSMDLLQRLIIHLRELEERYAARASYQDAKKIHSVQIVVKDEIKSRLQGQNNKPDSDDTISFNSNSEDQIVHISSIKEKHEQELNKFDNETNEKINHMEKLHKQSITRFEQLWTEKPRQYQKPSQHLIELKKTERTLAMIGQYDQATIINAEATNLAKEEAAENQKKIVDDYKKARQKLLEKQNREMQSIISNRAEQRLMMESKQQREIESAINRQNVNRQRNRSLSNARNKTLNSSQFSNPSNSRSTSNVSIKVPSVKKAFVVPSYISSRPSTRCRIYSLPPATKASIWAKNVTSSLRSSPQQDVQKSTNTSSCSNIQSIRDQQPSLLPPLIPPTDPSITEMEEKEKKEKAKCLQQAALRRENEKKKRMELIRNEIERERQIKEQNQKALNKNNKKTVISNSKEKEDKKKQIIYSTTEENNNDDKKDQFISNNVKENNDEAKNLFNNNDIKENDDESNLFGKDQMQSELTNSNDKANSQTNLGKDEADDDSEYYYYEEEIMDEEEDIKENIADFVPISSCGSSSFHKLSSITTENPLPEAVNNNNASSNIISNNSSKNSVKFDNDRNDFRITKKVKKDSKMYDASDPLFHSAPNLKKAKENSQSDEVFNGVKNERSFSTITSKNGIYKIQPSDLTSMSVSDFELDSIPLDVTSYSNSQFRDYDFTLNIPFDENYLNSLEGKPTALSQNPSTIDIKELTKQIGSQD